ncbi:MAG: cyclic nucleotide-binding domain-containing protein [Planctomycetota bacterium]
MVDRQVDEPLGRLEGRALSVSEMLALPVFEGCSETLLRKNEGAVVRRKFRPDEIICREGEFGSTAFYILEGEAEVFIASPLARLKGSPRRAGLFGGIRTFLQSLVKSTPEEEVAARASIPIDASTDLSFEHPVARLGEGELFGEMTCMSFYPRSATVRAVSEVIALEMLRNVLDILKRGSKSFREQLERNYLERALDAHLRSLPLFSGLTDEFIDSLRDRVELVQFRPGEVICAQGDEADRLFLIRIGFVKVSQSSPGGEVTLQYLHRGDYFGEMGLLGAGYRTATCTALDHVELVQISGEDFDRMTEAFPAIKAGMEETARVHAKENAQRMERLRTVSVDRFLEQGLMEAQSLLLIDLDRCTRCDDCVRACALSHDGVTRLIRDGLRYDRWLVPTSCRSCHDPLCMIGCPVGSIRRKESLEIVIEDWCIGCGLCARNCPYGNINMHSFEDPQTREVASRAAPAQKAITCDLCSDLPEPSCVYACPHDAALRVDPQRFFAEAGR